MCSPLAAVTKSLIKLLVTPRHYCIRGVTFKLERQRLEVLLPLDSSWVTENISPNAYRFYLIWIFINTHFVLKKIQIRSRNHLSVVCVFVNCIAFYFLFFIVWWLKGLEYWYKFNVYEKCTNCIQVIKWRVKYHSREYN